MPGDDQPRDTVPSIEFLVTHVLQQVGRGALVTQPHGDRVEAANGVIPGKATLGPGRARVIPDLDQSETVAVRPGKIQPLLTEAFRALEATHTEARQTALPEA